MNSIKKELIIIVSLVILISLGALGATNFYFLNNNINLMIQERLDNQVEIINQFIKSANNKGYSEKEIIELVKASMYKNNIKDYPENLEINLSGKGFIFIFDKTGKFIVHPAFEGQNKLKDSKTFTKIYEEKNGIFNYISPKTGTEKIAAFRTIDSLEWTVVSTAFTEGIIGTKVNDLTKSFLVVSIVAFILICLAIFIYASKLSNSIKTVRDSIDKIANSDLSGKDLEVTEKHEIGDLKNYYNKMKNNLKELISEIRQESEILAASSEQLTATSEQISIASDEVAQTIQEIASGATDQAEETTKGAMDINVLGNIITSEIELVKKLNQSSKTVDKLNEENFVVLKDLEEKTAENNEATNQVHNIIIETNENVDEIKQTSNMIKNIAEQTNLLALNASIEAARAGEAGRGFAVVADEIRKLAEETNQFASEISDTIEKLNIITEKGVVTMKKVNELAKNQMTSLDNTHNKFEGISEAIKDVDNVVEELNESTNSLLSKKNQIINIIENLSAISEENAAGTQQASASVEEQTSSMSQISEASEDLAKLAENMQSNTFKFKI